MFFWSVFLQRTRPQAHRPQQKRNYMPAWLSWVIVVSVSVACFVLGTQPFPPLRWMFLRNEISDRRYLSDPQRQQTREKNVDLLVIPSNPHKGRILYIVTSIHEYDTGFRSTVKGFDRFTKTIIPLIRESVQSIPVPSS
jgi:hypothetical protein